MTGDLVIEEQMLPDLGCIALSSAKHLDQTVYCAKLHLNAYQSNCLSQWLSMRWSVSALKGSSLVLGEDARLLVHVPLLNMPSGIDSDEAATTQFQLWRDQLQQQMTFYIQAHA
ncbi:MAG TPA: hypothetical protein VFV57_00515 [Limnobacter sp.]|nr:hypothetical protein [Limnobacter sp.]